MTVTMRATAVVALGVFALAGCTKKIEGTSYSGTCANQFTKFEFTTKETVRLTVDDRVRTYSYKFDGKNMQMPVGFGLIFTATIDGDQLTTTPADIGWNQDASTKCILKKDGVHARPNGGDRPPGGAWSGFPVKPSGS